MNRGSDQYEPDPLTTTPAGRERLVVNDCNLVILSMGSVVPNFVNPGVLTALTGLIFGCHFV